MLGAFPFVYARTPLETVPSVHTRAVYVQGTGEWRGRDNVTGEFLERTPESDAAALADFEAGRKAVLEADGVNDKPVLLIPDRRYVVPCILHCTMAVGRQVALFINRWAATVGRVARARANVALRSFRVKWRIAVGTDVKPKLKGDETRRLFKAWPKVARALGIRKSSVQHTPWVLSTSSRLILKP